MARAGTMLSSRLMKRFIRTFSSFTVTRPWGNFMYFVPGLGRQVRWCSWKFPSVGFAKANVPCIRLLPFKSCAYALSEIWILTIII